MFGQLEEAVLQFGLQHIVGEHRVEDLTLYSDAGLAEHLCLRLEVVAQFLGALIFKQSLDPGIHLSVLLEVFAQVEVDLLAVVQAQGQAAHF